MRSPSTVRTRQLLLVLWLLSLSIPAEAYIGPGAGVSFLQGLWVTLVSIVMSLYAAIRLPIRLLIRRFGKLRALLLLAGVGALAWFALVRAPTVTYEAVDGRVIVLGFDGMDPVLAQRWMDAGLMPNFSRLAASGSFGKLATTNPAQSPVAWSSFATGTNPGAHGIFDFLRRSRDNYEPDFAISETRPTQYTVDLAGLRIPADGGEVVNRRIGEPFWVTAEKRGLRASVLRVPVTYPPDNVFQMLSGMGVPDLVGSQGTYTIFTTGRAEPGNARIRRVVPGQDGVVQAELAGPPDPLGRDRVLVQAFSIAPAPRGVDIRINGRTTSLQAGQWSDWVPVRFGFAGPLHVPGMVRLLLLESYPALRLYVSPVQVDPRDPALPISSPPGFAAELAGDIGLYHTLGMPEETWSLNDGQITDEAYLDMVRTTFAEREAMWYRALEARSAELVVGVFVQTDRVSHMFYRGIDEQHPLHAGAGESARGAVQWIYQEADRVLGETLERMDSADRLIVLSDHGFAPFRKVVHLNRWLADEGYLVLEPGREEGDVLFEGVDWSRTRAYALGLNGLYVNQEGREPQGSVEVSATRALKAELSDRLGAALDPATGEPFVAGVFDRDAIYEGLATAESPDLVVGYAKDYRASWQTTLGGTPRGLVEDNLEKWSGDHCIDPSLVPGVLFTSFPLAADVRDMKDVPGLVLDLLEARASD